MVLHGHFRINGRKTDVPSYSVKPGDQITWKESVKTTEYYADRTNRRPQTPRPHLAGPGRKRNVGPGSFAALRRATAHRPGLPPNR